MQGGVMHKIYRKMILSVFLVFLLPGTAWANGGIPVWITTVQAVAATLGVRGFGSLTESFISTIVCLLAIIGLETAFIKQKYLTKAKPGRLLEAVSLANLLSTAAGGVLLCALFYLGIFINQNSLAYLLLGPMYWVLMLLPENSFFIVLVVVLYNMFFCWFSYLIERPFVRLYLRDDYGVKDVDKAVLKANVMSYCISFFLILPLYLVLV